MPATPAQDAHHRGDQELEASIAAIGQALVGHGGAGPALRAGWLGRALLASALERPALRTQLFRMVDVFPSLHSAHEVLDHVEEYLARAPGTPAWVRAGVYLAERVPFGDRALARLTASNIRRMAGQFVAGRTGAEAAERLGSLWAQGFCGVVDLLGEKTVTEAEADRYAASVADLIRTCGRASRAWPTRALLEQDHLGPLGRAHVAVKPTALAPAFSPTTAAAGLAQARSRLVPLALLAAEHDACLHLDMEHYQVKDLTRELVASLLDDPALAHVRFGTVVQAYLRDAPDDLAELLARSRHRAVPLSVRLVKGAYWDAETVHARAAGWPVPVHTDKASTDAAYERCTRVLLEHHTTVRAQFASHNVRSLAVAVATARALGVPDDGFELQMLYGMGGDTQAAARDLGVRLRVYCPVGELVPGMAYLVRRLLENTSNESFVRLRSQRRRRVGDLLAPPRPDPVADAGPPPAPGGDDVRSLDDTYRPEPVVQWHDDAERDAMRAAVERRRPSATPIDVPAVVGPGTRVHTAERIASVDPGRPSVTVAESASCGPAEADAAVAGALGAFGTWSRVPARQRAEVLARAAAWMRARRRELAALEVWEAAKPWPEADADVCEAIDFCEYYAREALRLARGGVVQSPPGEHNTLRYEPRGVGAVIAPWNFPLAIPTGMTVGALAVGNTVVLKPAEQAPAVAWQLVLALEAAGLPPGALQFLPGRGEVVGAHLVRHPDVSFVVFTGSGEVGRAIIAEAAAHRPGMRHVKRVVAEMGGKNAIVVDADADVDVAVPAIVASAFGFSGQKCSACSRVVVVGDLHDELVRRLAGAVAALRVGHASAEGTQVGPLIDADAHRRLTAALAEAREHGTVLAAPLDPPAEGWYVAPAVVTGLAPDSRLATEELFGPLLVVLRAATFDEAIEVANRTDYALTAGVLSRSPSHIAEASQRLRAGNVYVNRSITGAVVGRQPFGGYGLSGVGSKAGGPDYLGQFVEPRVVTENTVRQGFAPLDEA